MASGGGHWVQLMRLRPAFEGHDVAYVSVDARYRDDVAGHAFHVVRDATRWNRLGLLAMACKILLVLLRERPDVVLSTGAAPGVFALRLGRWLGAKAVWLDSIANIERISMSGGLVGPKADLWLTQWPHLAREGGPEFRGAVL